MSTSSTKAAVDSRVDPSHFAFCHPICTPQSLCCIALLIATAPTLRSVNYSNAQKKPPHTQPRQPATRRALEIATSPCDGVKCMSCDLNLCMSVSCRTVRSDAAEVGAERCGAERRIRSGAMTILRRSVASTNAIQKCLPINKHGIISTNFEAHLVRFRPVSCALGPCRSPDISCRSPDISPAI